MSPLEQALQHYTAEVVVVAASVVIVGWILQYTYYQPWWKDPVGRTFVYKDMFLLFGFLVPVAITSYVVLSPGFVAWLDWYVILSIGAIPVVMAWRMWVWHKIRRDDLPPRGRSKDHAS